MEKDRTVLKQTIAMLFALADVAERASVRSLPVLWLVIWLLRPAEARSRCLVIEASRDLGGPVELCGAQEILAPVVGGGSRADALRLALTFRMLAAMLEVLVELASRRGKAISFSAMAKFLPGDPGRPVSRLLLATGAEANIPAFGFHDTS